MKQLAATSKAQAITNVINATTALLQSVNNLTPFISCKGDAEMLLTGAHDLGVLIHSITQSITKE